MMLWYVTAQGLIPARAGSTRSRMSRRLPLGAHPRSRGEHAEWLGKVLGPAGSSPLARGARTATPRMNSTDGLIPARAGSTPGTDSVL